MARQPAPPAGDQLPAGQPYWAFQWYETAFFLALAAALAGCCVWQIRYRRLP